VSSSVRAPYIARENDYQAAAQQAQLIRALYETQNELVLEQPVVMADDEAKRTAWAILASAWVERDSFELFLPPSFLALEGERSRRRASRHGVQQGSDQLHRTRGFGVGRGSTGRASVHPARSS
jgi:Putative phage tail protein